MAQRMSWSVTLGGVLLAPGCLPPEAEDDDALGEGTLAVSAGEQGSTVIPATGGMISATSPEQATTLSETGDATGSGSTSEAGDVTDTGSEASSTGGTTLGASTLPSGDEATSSTTGDASGDSGSAACQVFYPDLCGDCINAGCCEPAQACTAQADCELCLAGDAACVVGPTFDALAMCVGATCPAECAYGDFGIGETVEACQGVARYSGEVAGLEPVATTGFVYSSTEMGTQIWLDSRPFIASLAEVPADGDWAIGILPMTSTGTSTYDVTVVVGLFEAATQSYRQVGVSETGMMLLFEYSGTDETEGLLCHGRAAGFVEAAFEGSEMPSTAEFSVPLLTPDFPSAALQRRFPLDMRKSLRLKMGP